MYKMATAFVIILCLCSLALAESSKQTTEQTTKQTVKSGLQPGARTFAFHVNDVTGPRKGSSLCYACAFGKHSVINIQATKIDDDLVALLKELDALVSPAGKIKGDSKHAFLVYLTEDPDVAAKELKAVASKLKLKNIPLTIYDELTGPPPYKISKDAEVTVMMWKDAKVTANHAFAVGGLDKDDVKAVLKSAKNLLKQ